MLFSMLAVRHATFRRTQDAPEVTGVRSVAFIRVEVCSHERPAYGRLFNSNRKEELLCEEAERGNKYCAVTEYLLLFLTVAVTTVAGVVDDSATITAILGAIGATVAGSRAITRGRQEWIRCGAAAGQIEIAMRDYDCNNPPYDQPDEKDQRLIARVNEIQDVKTSAWATEMSQLGN
jgi:hypothetical protein